MYKILSIICLCTLIVPFTSAQESMGITDSVMARKEYRDMEKVNHLWFNTQNAAGLSLGYFEQGTIGDATVSRQLYGYHRAQEGDARSSLNVVVDRFDVVGKHIRIYTKFGFNKDREYNRAWSDAMRTYNSNPYTSAGNVKGDYDGLDFTIHAKVASTELGRFTVGIGLDYVAGDLSRIRDPRNRNKLELYAVKPAMSFRLTDHHTFGIQTNYTHRKEKVSYKVLGDSKLFSFYTFTGMENASNVTSGYTAYGREYVSQTWGIGVNYNFKTEKVQSLLTLNADFENEDVWNYNSYKGSPGDYKVKKFDLDWKTNIQAAKILHAIGLTAKYTQGNASQLKQELHTQVNTSTNTTTFYWETLIRYKNRYQTETANFNLNYTLYGTPGNYDYNYYAGIDLKYNYFKNRYNLPHSQLMVRNYELMLNGGARVVNTKKAKLWIEPEFAYHNAISPSLTLNDETTDLAVNVLIPDMNYYNANYYRGALSVQYLFPVQVKEFNNQWYVKVKGEQLWANGAGKSRGLTVSIGLYTL